MFTHILSSKPSVPIWLETTIRTVNIFVGVVLHEQHLWLQLTCNSFSLSLFFYPLNGNYRLVRRDSIEIIVRRSKMGDWFLLYMLGENIDTIIFRDIMQDLSIRLGHNQHHRVPGIKGDILDAWYFTWNLLGTAAVYQFIKRCFTTSTEEATGNNKDCVDCDVSVGREIQTTVSAAVTVNQDQKVIEKN